MNTLYVSPGKRLGYFQLGMPINAAIKFIQDNGMQWNECDLTYSEKDPLAHFITIHIRNISVSLRFEPASQRLALIDVHDVSKVVLKYQNSIFSGIKPSSVLSTSISQDYFGTESIKSKRDPLMGLDDVTRPSFNTVYKVFGPTYPGSYSAQRSTFLLQYPGVCFFFPISPEHRASFLEGRASQPDFRMPNADSTRAKRLTIYYGTSLDTFRPPPLAEKHMYFESVSINLLQGIHLSKRDQTINFGSYVQDVLSVLGSPCRVFTKLSDKLRIHSLSDDEGKFTPKQGHSPEQRSRELDFNGALDETTWSSEDGNTLDYMFNYFDHGMDICFDGARHVVKKIILHTNCINSGEFKRYNKCNYSLRVSAPPAESDDEDHASPSLMLEGATTMSVAITGITADTPWASIQQVMGDAGRPMVKNPTDDDCPFGSTLCYAYEGIIFEVLANGYAASVTLFPKQ